MKKPSNPKERNAVKGALRRVFSRSELRKEALSRNVVSTTNPDRPRVKTWAYCSNCGIVDAVSNFDVDHIHPIVPLDKPLTELTWDQVVDRMWCDVSNLQILCSDCHDEKSSSENKERRRFKKGEK